MTKSRRRSRRKRGGVHRIEMKRKRRQKKLNRRYKSRKKSKKTSVPLGVSKRSKSGFKPILPRRVSQLIKSARHRPQARRPRAPRGKKTKRNWSRAASNSRVSSLTKNLSKINF